MRRFFRYCLMSAAWLTVALQGAGQTAVVFDTDVEACHYYRIPAIVQLPDGSLLAIADDRHTSDSDIGGNWGIDIVGKASHDGGRTWDGPIMIADGDGLREGFNDSHGDAAAVVDRTTGQVLLMCASGHTGFLQSTLQEPLRMGRYVSHDNGQTWTGDDVTDDIYGIFKGFPEVNALFFSSGRICQSSSIKVGSHYRIYSAVCGPTGVGSLVLYSDDLGETWMALGGPEARPTISPWGDEAKVEELPNGNVLLSCRSKQASTGGRLFNIYDYATGTWGQMAVSNSSSRGGTYSGNCSCNGELIIVPVMRTSDSCRMHLALQSIPLGPGRQQVSIYYKPLIDETGYDSPADFVRGWKRYRVTDRYSAYSTMVALRDGAIAFYHEDCNDNPGTSAYDLMFQTLSIEDITAGEYVSTLPYQASTLGDVDHDGTLSIADVVSLINLIIDHRTADDNAMADVDGDADLGIADVTALIDMILLKNKSQFPV